jgi:penicillin-binding protein 2
MYNKRIKIFIIFSALLLLVCLARLAQMQLLAVSRVQHEVAELKERRGLTQQLNTLRGKILDRSGRILAVDEPGFWVHIDYELSCFLDERVQKGKILKASKKKDPETSTSEIKEKIHNRIEEIQQIINICAQLGAVEPSEVQNEIQKINDFIWNRRTFQTWREKFPNSEVFDNYKSKISIPLSVAIADFNEKQPDPDKRVELINKVDIAEMNQKWPLLKLKTDDEIFAAQLEFLNVDGVEILPIVQRSYPYGTVAAQTIGWVGPATQQQDRELFENDRLSRYLEGEVCGREDGIEYVCESILRGRRGEKNFDIDKQLVSRTDSRLGQDVVLTLDIELQKRIEKYLTSYNHDPNCGPGMAAVVLDVETGDILALVSLPVYDLNRIRFEYDRLVVDKKNKPLINRTINANYPPGSVIKPLILIAGLETGMITADEVIPCPAQPAPENWPDCLIYRRYKSGHSLLWENSARNAIKGSCNIYFSRLANRMDPLILQHWLFMFGYGRKSLSPPDAIAQTKFSRNLRQSPGIISSSVPRSEKLTAEQMPPLRDTEKRYFGIGQWNLRTTPLQVANAMATIARGGVFKNPRLLKEMHHSQDVPLKISPETLAIVFDGMSAVINETHGTANKQFGPVLHTFTEQDVKLYGKTGSTEDPEHAWFAGFAEDSTGGKLAFAIVVEGGQHGSSDAAPLVRDIIQFCIESGYIGKSLNNMQGI